MTTWVDPTRQLAAIPPIEPKMWKYGTGTRYRSSAVQRCRSTYTRVLKYTLPWDSRQPFGSPVVPEV